MQSKAGAKKPHTKYNVVTRQFAAVFLQRARFGLWMFCMLKLIPKPLRSSAVAKRSRTSGHNLKFEKSPGLPILARPLFAWKR
jgi:hypothetical protein